MKYLMMIMLAATLNSAYAYDADDDRTPQSWQQAASDQLSLSEAADQVQRRTGGRVVSAQTVRQDGRQGGREIHRIKVVTPQGEVRIVYVDAQTGQMD